MLQIQDEVEFDDEVNAIRLYSTLALLLAFARTFTRISMPPLIRDLCHRTAPELRNTAFKLTFSKTMLAKGCSFFTCACFGRNGSWKNGHCTHYTIRIVSACAFFCHNLCNQKNHFYRLHCTTLSHNRLPHCCCQTHGFGVLRALHCAVRIPFALLPGNSAFK